MAWVVDASVAAKWLIEEEGTEAALSLRESGRDLTCPDLLFLEVGNVVWKKVRAGEIEEADGRAMIATLMDAPLSVEASKDLLPAAWEFAVRHDRTVYDGVYLALAVGIDGLLVTADHRLVNSLSGSDLEPRIVLVEDLEARVDATGEGEL